MRLLAVPTRAVVAFTTLLLALALAPLAAAVAAEPGPLTSVVNGNETNRLSGASSDVVQVAAPTACPDGTTRHVTTVTSVLAARPADRKTAAAWVGNNLYATSPVGLPGPLTVQASINWRGMAEALGLQLVPGDYRLELRCQDNLGTEIFQTWVGGVTFTSATAWTGWTGGSPTAAAEPSASPTAASASTTPSSAATDAGGSPATPEQDGSAAGAVADPPDAGDSGGDDGSALASTGASVLRLTVLGLGLLGLGAVLLTVVRRRRSAPAHRAVRR